MDLGGFGGRFEDDFGSLQVDFSKILRSFAETIGSTTPQEKQHTSGERCERASAASDASGAIQVFERIFFRILGEIHGNRRKEHDITGKT